MNLVKITKKQAGVAIAAFIMTLIATDALATEKNQNHQHMSINSHILLIMDDYAAIKKALDSDSAKSVGVNADSIIKSTNHALEVAKKDADNNKALIESLNHLVKAASGLVESKDGKDKAEMDIKKARDKFDVLSDSIIRLVHKHLPAETSVKLQVYYCSMADKYWMQKSSDAVQNPYYGSKNNAYSCGDKVTLSKYEAVRDGKDKQEQRKDNKHGGH